MKMIVDAYQQILRNVEIKPRKSRKVAKINTENTASGWFAQYAPALAGLLEPKSAK
jgi:hypothetical protein